MGKLILILLLAGCASTARMDADLARLEQPGPAYACAAYLMGVDAPGPVPEIVWHDTYWTLDYTGRLVNGQYDESTNTIHVRREYQSSKRTVHENIHAIQAQRGEEFNELEAKKAGRWLRDCVNFGGL